MTALTGDTATFRGSARNAETHTPREPERGCTALRGSPHVRTAHFWRTFVHRKRLRARSFLALLTGALLAGSSLSAVPALAADPVPAAAESFQQVTLAKGADEVGEPMSLAVLPDRQVLHTSRDGTLRITDANGTTKVAGTLAVYSHDEEGLQGVGVDPDFAENRAIYLYYAPELSTPAGDAPENGTAADFAPFDGYNRLSRFTLNADGTLDNASEKKVLDVATSRGHLLPRRR